MIMRDQRTARMRLLAIVADGELEQCPVWTAFSAYIPDLSVRPHGPIALQPTSLISLRHIQKGPALRDGEEERTSKDLAENKHMLTPRLLR